MNDEALKQHKNGPSLAKSRMARLSLYYLLYFTSVGVFSPYFNLYLKSRGLNGQQIGVVLAVAPFVGLLAQSFWGVMNDRLGIFKWVMGAGILAPALGLFLFARTSGLLWFMCIAAGMAVFQTAVIPVADSMTYAQAGSLYGKIRLFGSLGYALTVAVAGNVLRGRGIEHLGWIYLVVAAVALIGVVCYPRPSAERFTKAPGSARWYEGLGKLLRQRWFLILLVCTLCGSISQGMNTNLYSLYYQALGRPLSWLGVIYAAGALSELPVFFASGRLIARFGPLRILILAFSVFAFRWIALAFAPPVWALLLLQLLHGVSFGLGLAAGVTLSAEVSDPSNRTTAQTVYSTVNTSISAICGSLFGGYLLYHLGPQGIYKVAATLAIMAVIGLSILTVRLRRGQEVGRV